MKIYLPWLGEFGSELLKWVSRIQADKDRKYVYYENGKGLLYPSATTGFGIPRIDEKQRKCAGSLNQQRIWDNIINFHGANGNQYIYPSTKWWSTKPEQNKPFEPQYHIIQHISCDVAVFPRWRHNTLRKNWIHWPELIDRLTSLGFKVFACGHPDSSYKVNCPAAWDYGYFLDASIEAIKNSKIRIGMVTALSILSLYCGKSPWVILNEKGAICNNDNDFPNWAYFKFADHKKVGWTIKPYFNNVDRLIEEVEWQLSLKS